jgi:hypothetical protein
MVPPFCRMLFAIPDIKIVPSAVTYSLNELSMSNCYAVTSYAFGWTVWNYRTAAYRNSLELFYFGNPWL